jgi:hypothetical protein
MNIDQAEKAVKLVEDKLSPDFDADLKTIYDAVNEVLDKEAAKPVVDRTDEEALATAEKFRDYVVERYPYYKPQIRLERWAHDIYLLHLSMRVDYDLINAVIKFLFEYYAPDSDFDWREQIRSGKSLRKHWIRLYELTKKNLATLEIATV